MVARGDCVTIHLTPNPEFHANRPFSYESVLCRLHHGWWMLGAGTVTVQEVIALKLAEC